MAPRWSWSNVRCSIIRVKSRILVECRLQRQGGYCLIQDPRPRTNNHRSCSGPSYVFGHLKFTKTCVCPCPSLNSWVDPNTVVSVNHLRIPSMSHTSMRNLWDTQAIDVSRIVLRLPWEIPVLIVPGLTRARPQVGHLTDPNPGGGGAPVAGTQSILD